MNPIGRFKSCPAHLVCQLTAVPPRWIALFLVAICLLLAGIVSARADTNSQIDAVDSGFQTVLDKQKELDRFTFWDNQDWDWYKQRIPFVETPDQSIDEIYYYRWELLTKHMVYASLEIGYVFSEFINRPGGYGTISCALGHHIDDLRWLKDRMVTDNYICYWHAAPGRGPRSYSNWYGHAVWNNYLVNADKAFLLDRLPSMEAQYQGWLDEHWDAGHQMFHWSGMHDGMEINIESRQTRNDFDGGDSYRPTLNSYVYGDLNAIANTLELAGDFAKAAEYRLKAQTLKQRVLQELWDPRRQFFISQFAHDEVKNGYQVKALSLVYQDGKFAGDSHGRELTGYVPWMFDLPDKDKGYEIAWKGMTDPEVFLALYGFYFAERHDPLFMVAQGGCVWSGNNWPYADAEVLTAMANVLNNYPQNIITKADYYRALQSYTRSQHKEGHPYVAECGDPDTGRWTQDTPFSSDDYNHSCYVDLIISGLFGLRPRADDLVEVNPLIPDNWDYFALDDVDYHGQRLSIIWDRDGTRYNRGSGLTILVNGRPIASSPTLGRLTGKLPALLPVVTSTALHGDRPINFAVNNDGAYFPKIRTSYNAPGTSAGFLNDGTYFYNQGHPRNRWTTEGSPNERDTIDLDFGAPRPLEQVKLYLLDDGFGQSVRAPASYELEYWIDGQWQPVPGQQRFPKMPQGHRPNNITFPTLSVERIRVVLRPRFFEAVGATELEAWGHATLPLSETHLPPDDLALQAKASASYTWQEDQADAINDGKISMNGGPRNRWTAYKTEHASDWVQLDFPNPVNVGRLEICLWGDNGGVHAPKSFQIQYWDGAQWVNVHERRRNPPQPTLFMPNEVTIDPVQTMRLRLTFVHDPRGASGLTEWMVWEK